MQITTIHNLQYALNTSLKVLQFVWRHVFVLAVFILLFAAFLIYPAIDWNTFFVEIVIAVGLDKIKMRVNPIARRNNASEQMLRYARADMDSGNFGSSAWAMNPMQPSSPANHLYNLGYMTTKY